MQAFPFSKTFAMVACQGCPRPATPTYCAHFCSYLANVCSWHSITNISFGSMQIWRRLWQLLSQSAPKSMLEFCVLPQGRTLLIFVLPSLCTFGHVISKSISNRVATTSSSPSLTLPFFCLAIFLHENHELVVKKGATLTGNGGKRGIGHCEPL